MKTIHLLISGKVQGVFFRESAKRLAEELNIKGWIRNTSSSEVEAIISGKPEDIDRFVEWSKRGPEKAMVKNVAASNEPETEFKKFKVIR